MTNTEKIFKENFPSTSVEFYKRPGFELYNYDHSMINGSKNCKTVEILKLLSYFDKNKSHYSSDSESLYIFENLSNNKLSFIGNNKNMPTNLNNDTITPIFDIRYIKDTDIINILLYAFITFGDSRTVRYGFKFLKIDFSFYIDNFGDDLIFLKYNDFIDFDDINDFIKDAEQKNNQMNYTSFNTLIELVKNEYSDYIMKQLEKTLETEEKIIGRHGKITWEI